MAPIFVVILLPFLLFLSLSVVGGMTADDLLNNYYFYEPDSVFVDYNGTIELPVGINSGMRWPVNINNLTSSYGWRIHPIYKDRRFHHGIDISAKKNTPVYASASGEVAFAGHHRTYGNLIVLDHMIVNELEAITTYYAHLNSMKVKKGDTINQGDLIGHVGSTGLSTGAHLHFETRYKEKSFNPLLVLGEVSR